MGPMSRTERPECIPAPLVASHMAGSRGATHPEDSPALAVFMAAASTEEEDSTEVAEDSTEAAATDSGLR